MLIIRIQILINFSGRIQDPHPYQRKGSYEPFSTIDNGLKC